MAERVCRGNSQAIAFYSNVRLGAAAAMFVLLRLTLLAPTAHITGMGFFPETRRAAPGDFCFRATDLAPFGLFIWPHLSC